LLPHEDSGWAHYVELCENSQSSAVVSPVSPTDHQQQQARGREGQEEEEGDLLLDLAACGLEGPISPYSGSNCQFIYEDLQDNTPPYLTPRKQSFNVSSVVEEKFNYC